MAWFTILYTFSIIIIISKGQDDDYILSDLKLVTWDLADECTDEATLLRKYLLGQRTIKDKIDIEIDRAKLLKTSSEKLSSYDYIPYSVERNVTNLLKCGNSLLPAEDYENLINFANKNLELSRTSKILCFNTTQECHQTRQEVRKILESSRDKNILKYTWEMWQKNLEIYKNSYPSSLKLINKAAELNDCYNSEAYWSLLTDVKESYQRMETIWEEIEPLYLSLHGFVLEGINKIYNTSYQNIPVYLTGSKFGEDWVNIADLILPIPQINYDINIELKEMDVKDFYKFAQNFTRSLKLKELGKHFWKSSNFNYEDCTPVILNFCTEDRNEVFVCNKSSLSTYLDAFEVAMRIAIDKYHMEYLPLRDIKLSPVDDGLIQLSTLYAMNNLPYYGILDYNVFLNEARKEDNKMMMLLLLSMRILPKLAYYRAVEKWRFNELEFPSEDIFATWWESRQKYQGIKGETNTEADFLEDEYILYNKPYFSKFFGLILQFQILNYYSISLFQDATNPVNSFLEHSSFIEIIENSEYKNPLELLGYHYGIDDFNAAPLKDFFSPLVDYFRDAPVQQEPIIQKRIKQTTRIQSTSSEVTTAILLNDEISNSTLDTTRAVEASGQNIGFYIFIAIGILALIGLGGVIFLKRKRENSGRRIEA